MRSDARSRWRSRAVTVASNSRPSQSCTQAGELRVTCALVTISPSPVQITPEPLPRCPACRRTVERRSFSAISPKPMMAILVDSVQPLAHGDAEFPHRAAADDLCRQRPANILGMELRLHVLELCNGVTGQGQENIANQNACLLRWAAGFHFENNDRCLFFALERFAKRVRQTHRLQSHAKIALRDAALFKKSIGDAIHDRRGDAGRSETPETRRGDSSDLPVHTYDRATRRRGLQANVKADVRCERRARPGATFRGDETDDAQCGHWTAGTCATHNEREAPRFQRVNPTEFRGRGASLGALENGEIRGRITANQRRGHDAAASDGQVNLLVAAQCVLRSDDYS